MARWDVHRILGGREEEVRRPWLGVVGVVIHLLSLHHHLSTAAFPIQLVRAVIFEFDGLQSDTFQATELI